MELQELKQQVAQLSKKIEILEAKEKETIKYPIYCLQQDIGLVVKFTKLREGVVVKNGDDYNVNQYYNDWVPHTAIENWTQLEVCPTRGLFDGQLVSCYYHRLFTHSRVLAFFDAKNQRAFSVTGDRIGENYDIYEPYEGNYPEWAQEAFNTLKR